MTRDSWEGFTVTLTLDEDDEWFATFAELPSVSAFAETPDEALEELKTAWELYKQTCIDLGEPIPIAPSRREYSGHLNIRIDKRLHRELAMEAALAGTSLNALIAQKLATSTKVSSVPPCPQKPKKSVKDIRADLAVFPGEKQKSRNNADGIASK